MQEGVRVSAVNVIKRVRLSNAAIPAMVTGGSREVLVKCESALK